MWTNEEDVPRLVPYPRIPDQRGSMSIIYDVSTPNSFGSISIVKMTESHRGVIRGFHYQQIPAQQRKKIVLLDGSIQDVLIELNEKGCPTGKTCEFILSSTRDSDIKPDLGKAIEIPYNWAHAYLTLSDQSKVLYICDNIYANEISLNPLKFYSKWMINKENIILSEKDSQ